MKTDLNEISSNTHLTDYENDLKECTKEVLRVTNAIDSYGLINDKIIDLSGGMDTRIVFSAFMNIQDASKKYKIRTTPYPIKDDYLVGTTIADDNNFNYAFGIEEQEDQRIAANWEYTVTEYLNSFHSYNMGTCYEAGGEFSPKNSNNEMILSGAFGEPVSRVCFSNKYLNSDLDVMDDPEEFFTRFLQDITWSALLDYYKAGKYFKDIFLNEITNSPFSSFLHNLEMLEAKYRGRYHHDLMRESWYGMRNIRIPLLYCPKTFLAFHKYFEVTKNRKFTHDLIEALYKGMDAYDYAGEEYNIDKKRLNLLAKNENIPFHVKSNRYERQNRIYEMKKRRQIDTISSQHKKNMEEFLSISDVNANLIKPRMLNALRYICNHNELFCQNAGALLFIYANNPPSDKDKKAYRYRVIYNKLMSVALQMKIFEVS